MASKEKFVIRTQPPIPEIKNWVSNCLEINSSPSQNSFPFYNVEFVTLEVTLEKKTFLLESLKERTSENSMLFRH